MPTPPITELNARARDIFAMVVEHYLESGAPVGSRTLSKGRTLNLSPASIRNVMQDLEEMGLLAAPHHSAGRLPTEAGLRLFVDGMMQAAEPSAAERRAIEQRVSGEGPIEAMLSETTAVLSGLSACAGIVMVPKHEQRLRQISLVPLGDAQALCVLVGQDGGIENRIITLPAGVTASALIEASNYASARLNGLTLAEAEAQLAREINDGHAAVDRIAANLVASGLALWSRDGAERPVLIVRGAANLIDPSTAEDLDRVRQLLDELDGKEEIARILDSARAGAATKIFIGSENKLFSLSGSSVIAAPYRDRDGRVVGVVGVIGPTRLNYARIVPMVDFTAQAISKLMR